MTLSQAAVLTRQIITITFLVLSLGLAGFIGYKIWYASYLVNLPPVEEKPDTKFGLLPQIDFPSSAVSSSNFSYSIDTSTGNLPKFEKIAKVYFVTKTLASLLSAEKSQTLAEKFGISSQPEILSETKYRFKDKVKTLIVDLDNGNFTFTNESITLSQEKIDDDNQLVSDFKRTLSNLGVLKEDLQKGPSKIVRDEDNAVQISLWPAPIDNEQSSSTNKPILTSQFSTSLVMAKVDKSASDINNYQSLNFTYYPIDTSTFATYPIKLAEEAFADLKSGKGVVILEAEKPQVSITSIYLGYYLADSYNPYLEPIFVFEGPGFVAYVPAIAAEFQTPSDGH